MEHCLCSVTKACNNIDAEIFVVDNASTDDSELYLQDKFPHVKFKWNKTNLGFAKANNSVLPQTTGDFILFLNPDTIVPEDCFEKCIAFFSKDPDCGALGVHMIDGSGNFLKESKRSFPSPSTSFYKMLGLGKLFPHSKVFAKYYAGHSPENKTISVDVLAGAFIMIPRKVLNRVKGFDEDYFMYAEDIDLSYRIKLTGYKNVYFAGTSIIHFKGESTLKKSRIYTKQFYGAMKMFVKKHYSDNKITQKLMYLAISIGSVISNGRRVLNNLADIVFAKFLRQNKNESIIIAGSQNSFNEMIQLIKHSSKPYVIAGRVAVNNEDEGIASCTISTIAALVKENNIDNVLFCEKDLSNSAIINLTMELKGTTKFLFHSNNSHSIIGSNKKDRKGIFITEL